MRTKNPILWRELLHQRRSIPRLIQIMDSVGIVAIVLVLVIILFRIMLSDLESSYQFTPNVMAWVQVFSWVIHALAAIRAIFAGADVIRRDSGSLNWDDLKLVNMSPIRFLVGKWRAALRRVRGWMVALGIIQIALVSVILSFYVISIYQSATGKCIYDLRHYSSEVTGLCNIATDDQFQSWQKWSPLSIPFGVVTAVTLSIFEIIASTALGVAAGLVFLSNLLAPLGALLIRLLPVIIYSGWPNYYSSAYYLPASEIWMWRWYEYTWFSIADGGTTALMRIINLSFSPYGVPYGRSIESIPMALAASLALFGVLFLGSMLVSWFVLRFGLLRRQH